MLSTGTPGWVLISQVDHARLSGAIAAAWGRPPFVPPSPHSEVVEAVAHHDDGWHEWDSSPDVDSDQGRPRSFLEMPLDVALDIWSRSIAQCAAIGPLAAWIVAGHFSALLSGSDSAAQPQARAWLEKHNRQREEWLAAQREPHEAAEQALKHLQLFDALSLWLCMAERTKPEMFHAPGSGFMLRPQDAARINVDPWPLGADSLTLEVTGRLIPKADYANRAELAAAPSERVRLEWVLERPK